MGTPASWRSGELGNPNGRPVGARNKRTTEIVNQIIASGNQDPLLTLSELQAKSQDEGIRATAANMLAPFLHSKWQSSPVPRYVEHPIEIPKFETIEDAENFLGQIPSLLNDGLIDRDLAQEYSTLTKNWIDAKYARDELRLKMAQANAGDQEQVIQIRGGLPSLPGCDVIMPQLNGHTLPEIPAPSPVLGEPSSEALGSSTNNSSLRQNPRAGSHGTCETYNFRITQYLVPFFRSQ